MVRFGQLWSEASKLIAVLRFSYLTSATTSGRSNGKARAESRRMLTLLCMCFKVVDLLVSMCRSALESPRKVVIFEPYPSVVDPNDPQMLAFNPRVSTSPHTPLPPPVTAAEILELPASLFPSNSLPHQAHLWPVVDSIHLINTILFPQTLFTASFSLSHILLFPLSFHLLKSLSELHLYETRPISSSQIAIFTHPICMKGR